MFEDERCVTPAFERRLQGALAGVGRAQRELLSLIAELDPEADWEQEGAHRLAHYLCMRLDLPYRRAERMLEASGALAALPGLSAALSRGELGLDKVLELARFATPEREEGLIAWATQVSCARIRDRADLERRIEADETLRAEQDRSLTWWYAEQGTCFQLFAQLPAAQGAVVAKALERVAASSPPMPGEEGAQGLAARRADALYALCAAPLGADPAPERSAIVIHAPLSALAAGSPGAHVEDGPPIPVQSLQRLACAGKAQIVIEGAGGKVLGLGRGPREPSAPLRRLVRYRDRGCRFPGCGTRAFTQAHHIRFWSEGGATELSNLVLVCSLHHRIVHEYGWRLQGDPAGELIWRRPDGTRYLARPSPETGSDARSGADPPVQVAVAG